MAYDAVAVRRAIAQLVDRDALVEAPGRAARRGIATFPARKPEGP
ncbi:hypothetical protein AB0L71_30765 [Streptomyces sp. NPDC052052]